MGFGWKLTISFALLFVIGALCGATITLTLGSLHQFNARLPGPVSWEQAAMRNLTRQLDLTPDQQEKVRVPIHEAIEKLRAIRQKTIQETNEAFDETLAGLAPLLNSDQQKKLEEFRARRMARQRAALSKPTP
jgi:flagellar motility protein MotE (MotC chaperone)